MFHVSFCLLFLFYHHLHTLSEDLAVFLGEINEIYSASVHSRNLKEQKISKNLFISFTKDVFAMLLLSYKKYDSW